MSVDLDEEETPSPRFVPKDMIARLRADPPMANPVSSDLESRISFLEGALAWVIEVVHFGAGQSR